MTFFIYNTSSVRYSWQKRFKRDWNKFQANFCNSTAHYSPCWIYAHLCSSMVAGNSVVHASAWCYSFGSPHSAGSLLWEEVEISSSNEGPYILSHNLISWRWEQPVSHWERKSFRLSHTLFHSGKWRERGELRWYKSIFVLQLLWNFISNALPSVLDQKQFLKKQ